jgi:hypothetical protein
MGRFMKLWRALFGTKPTPLCHSNHYNPEHFKK